MTTTSVDALVKSYLSRLDAAAIVLPPDRREELIQGIGEHISAACAAGAAADEAAVRTLLDRLGEPELIVAAALDTPLPVASTQARWGTLERWGALEIVGLLLLGFGSFVKPFIFPLIGVVLVCCSRRWTIWDKVVASVLTVASISIFFSPYLFAAVAYSGLVPRHGLLTYALFIGLGPALAALYLLVRLRARPWPRAADIPNRTA